MLMEKREIEVPVGNRVLNDLLDWIIANGAEAKMAAAIICTRSGDVMQTTLNASPIEAAGMCTFAANSACLSARFHDGEDGKETDQRPEGLGE